MLRLLFFCPALIATILSLPSSVWSIKLSEVKQNHFATELRTLQFDLGKTILIFNSNCGVSSFPGQSQAYSLKKTIEHFPQCSLNKSKTSVDQSIILFLKKSQFSFLKKPMCLLLSFYRISNQCRMNNCTVSQSMTNSLII